MYSEEYDNEDDEQESGNFVKNFYYNNKVLVWIFIGIIAFILIMSLLTKGGSNKTTEAKKVSVTIYPEEKEIRVTLGYSTNLIATVQNSPQANVEWSAEDSNIVKVDNDGNVMGLNYGKTTVTATYIHSDKQVYSDSKTIIVADGEPGVAINDVAFKNGDLFMPINSTYPIRLVINPPSGYVENKTFISSNPNVAMVDNTGLVTAVGEGEAVITIDVNGQFRDELNVYVDRDYKETEIVVTPDKIDLDGELRKIKVGEKSKLNYTVEPEDTDRSRLTWTSSDESVVTVDEGGWITGIQTGNAVVTVSSINGKSDRISIEVENDIVPVTDIELSVENIYVSVGQTQTITPIVRPDNASNKALSYSSEDSSVASVSPNETGTQATITGNSAGTTTVIIQSTDNVEKRITVTVTGGGTDPQGGQESENPQGGGNSATIVVRVNGDKPTKSCDGQTLKYYNNPTVKVSLNSGIGKIRYCYGTSKCTPNQEATSSTSFTIGGKGLYTLRIKKYDRNGNEIASSDSGNYYDGALEYYINTKGEGTTCQKSTATPKPTGDLTTTCSGITNITKCNATGGCSWCSGKCRKIESCICCCTTNKSQCSWLYGCTASQPSAVTGVTTENACKNRAVATGAPNPTTNPTPASTITPTVECKNPTYNGKEQVVAECKDGVVKGTSTKEFRRTNAGYYQVTCVNNTSGNDKSASCQILPSPTPTSTQSVPSYASKTCNFLRETEDCDGYAYYDTLAILTNEANSHKGTVFYGCIEGHTAGKLDLYECK